MGTMEYWTKLKKVSINIPKYLAVIGGILILIPTDFLNVWGNLSAYILSYFYSKDGIVPSELHTPWLLSAYALAWNCGLFVCGLISFLNPRASLLLGITLFNTAVVACYFALRHVTTPLLFSGIVVLGLSTGFVDSNVFQLVAEWSDSEAGSLISIASSGMSIGPCIMNPLISFYINPENLSPEFEIKEMKLFDQARLLNKVPSIFWILAVAYLACQMAGFFMLCQKPKKKIISYEQNNRYGSVLMPRNGENVESNTTHGEASNNGSVPSGEISEINTGSCENGLSDGGIQTTQRDLTMSQTLRCNVFHVLFFTYACQDFSNLFLNNYYKTFGQNWIKDDHLLTVIGSAIALASGAVRVLWGIALNRYSIKTCLIIIFSSMPLFNLVMYFTPPINKYLYFVTTLLFGCIRSCVYPTYLSAMLEFFGVTHFAKNLGLLSVAAVLTNFIIPPVFGFLLVAFGWFYLFCCCSSLTAVSLVIIVWKFPGVNAIVRANH